MELTTKLLPEIQIPFSLGIFEDCILQLRRMEPFGWDGVVAYPEKLSIRNEYPYLIPAEQVYMNKLETRLLFYPSGDMHGGYYDGDPTAVLHVRVRRVKPDTVHITLDLEERLQWVSDVDAE